MITTAYVTTLCNGDGYLPGVEALGKSLDRAGAQHPKLVMVTPDVPRSARDRLAAAGWLLRDIEPIPNPHPETAPLYVRFANTFAKLRAFELDEVRKLVFMDADTIALQNIDELFARPAFAAGPDFFLPDRFSSGLMVIEPNRALFTRMRDALRSSSGYDGGDQGFLNTFIPDWYAMPAAHRLPCGYNMHNFIFQFLRGNPSLKAQLEHEVKVIHYAVQKPWLVKTTLSGGSEAWWNMYFGAHPEESSSWKRRLHSAEDWSFDKLVATLIE
jgi:alpha-N-acetylglucosamine transferase